MREKMIAAFRAKVVDRLREGQRLGEIDPEIDIEQAASFIEVTMSGFQLAARGGAGAKELHALAAFAVERLRAR